jgi:hypothetical protein
VPPSAVSKSPTLSDRASVKAPRLWPKSSLSRRASGIAPQFTATKGPSRRGPRRWSARATSSLPVPLSPSMRTVVSKAAATSPARRSDSTMAGLVPMMREKSYRPTISSRRRRFSWSTVPTASARSMTSFSSSSRNGFVT